MFSALACGAFLVITGLTGWNANRVPWFERGGWTDGPIWSQVMLGVVFLLLGAYWSRRLGEAEWTTTRAPRGRTIKHAGHAQSAGARSELPRRKLVKTDSERYESPN